MEEVSKCDINKLLPKKGMLYFYISPLFYNDKMHDFGKVIYVPSSENLVNVKSSIAVTMKFNGSTNAMLSVTKIH